MKSKIAKEYAKKVKLVKWVNKGSKKRKFLAGVAIEDQKAVSNMDSFYSENDFWDSAKKKKAVEKDLSDKKY